MLLSLYTFSLKKVYRISSVQTLDYKSENSFISHCYWALLLLSFFIFTFTGYLGSVIFG